MVLTEFCSIFQITERKDVFFSRPKKPLTLKGLIRALRKFTQSREKIKQAIYLKFDLPQNVFESPVMSQSTASQAVGQLYAPTTERLTTTSPTEGQPTTGPRTPPTENVQISSPTEGWSTVTPPYPKSKPTPVNHYAGAYNVPFEYYSGRKRGIFSTKVR